MHGICNVGGNKGDMAVKKTVSKKRTVKKRPAKQPVRSFHISKESPPFFSVAITRQTLYWGIIGATVLWLGLWTLKIQNDVNNLYDSIDASVIEQQ
jgi:hypothetical protein